MKNIPLPYQHAPRDGLDKVSISNPKNEGA